MDTLGRRDATVAPAEPLAALLPRTLAGLLNLSPSGAKRHAAPDSATDPDLTCIQLLQAGDGRGLDQLMERYADPLYSFIYRHTQNPQDAQDLVQETFVRVFRKAASFKPRATVKTWIYTIALNLCRDRARRASRIKWLPFLNSDKATPNTVGLQDTTPDHGPDPAQDAANHEFEKAVQEAVAALPDTLREPFVLCVLECQSQEQAAGILGVTAKAVEVKVYRARQRIRAALEPFLGLE